MLVANDLRSLFGSLRLLVFLLYYLDPALDEYELGSLLVQTLLYPSVSPVGSNLESFHLWFLFDFLRKFVLLFLLLILRHGLVLFLGESGRVVLQVDHLNLAHRKIIIF